MRKCQMCKEEEQVYAWQPFGPEPNCRDDGAFTALGNHYRGFPVLKIGENCRGEIGNGEWVSFDYQGKTYFLVGELPPMDEHEYRKGDFRSKG